MERRLEVQRLREAKREAVRDRQRQEAKRKQQEIEEKREEASRSLEDVKKNSHLFPWVVGDQTQHILEHHFYFKHAREVPGPVEVTQKIVRSRALRLESGAREQHGYPRQLSEDQEIDNSESNLNDIELTDFQDNMKITDPAHDTLQNEIRVHNRSGLSDPLWQPSADVVFQWVKPYLRESKHIPDLCKKRGSYIKDLYDLHVTKWIKGQRTFESVRKLLIYRVWYIELALIKSFLPQGRLLTLKDLFQMHPYTFQKTFIAYRIGKRLEIQQNKQLGYHTSKIFTHECQESLDQNIEHIMSTQQNNNGASLEMIDKIPSSFLTKNTQKPKESSSRCTVCFSDFIDGRMIRILPCGHCFHTICCDPWLFTSSTCPNCRTSIFGDDRPKTET